MRFSSRDLPAHLNDRARFKLWHEIFNAEIADMNFTRAGDVPFDVTFRAVQIGPITFTQTFGTVNGAARSASQAAADDHYTVHIHVSDPVGGYYGNREVEIPTGGALVNASQSQALTGGNYNSWLLIRMPIALLQSSFAGLDSSEGQVIAPDREALRLLRGYVGLLDLDAPASPSLVDHMAATIVDLTGLAIGARGDEAELAGLRGLRRARLDAVLARIRRDYTQPILSAAAVGAGLGLSARYVQDLLAATGTTFSERVLELRLQHAKQLLAAPHAAGMRIGDIVYAAGFNDISYFNRSFRRRFGCNPGAAR